MTWETLSKRRYRRPMRSGIGMAVTAKHVKFVIYRDLATKLSLRAGSKCEVQIGAAEDAGKVRIVFGVKDGRSLVAGTKGGTYLVLGFAPWTGGPREQHRVMPLRYSQFDNGIQVVLPSKANHPRVPHKSAANVMPAMHVVR